jgi:hypothetical protein
MGLTLDSFTSFKQNVERRNESDSEPARQNKVAMPQPVLQFITA